MNTDQLIEFSLCRLCAKDKNACITLNNYEYDKQLIEKLNFIVPEIFQDVVNFPEYICAACHIKLNEAYSFKKTTLEAHEQFKKNLVIIKEYIRSDHDYLTQNDSVQVAEDIKISDDLIASINKTLNASLIVKTIDEINNQTILSIYENKTQSNFTNVVISNENVIKNEHDDELINILLNNSEKANDDGIISHKRIENNNDIVKILNNSEKSQNCISTVEEEKVNLPESITVEKVENNNDKLLEKLKDKSKIIIENEVTSEDNKKILKRKKLNDVNIFKQTEKNAASKNITFYEKVCLNKAVDSIIHRNEQILNSNPINKTSYPCEKCNKVFKSQFALDSHLCDLGNDKNNICALCNERFRFPLHLNAHLRIHLPERPIKCSICEKTYSSPFIFDKHLQCHINDRLYKCQVCGKTFNILYNLNTHIVSHSYSDQIVKCELCLKLFKSTASLKQHIKIHTGVKPFKCDQCDKSFVKKTHLKTHNLVHTREKPYICECCGTGFSLHCNLRMHLNNKHFKSKENLKV